MSHWSPLLAAGRSVWRCCRATLPVYVLLAAVAGNPAAARAASPGLADGSDDYSSSSPAGVVLPLSLSAESELAAAARLMRRGQWEQSLPILQGLLETDGDRVIRDGKTYVPVADLVNRRLASAPEAAQGVYNLLYGPLAERLYQQAVRERSASMLADVARRYLNTRFGPLAISMLASLRMDEERPASALIALRRADILRLGAAAAKPIATKKILCLARLNRRADAQRIVRNLREDGITHLTVGGIEWEADALLQEAFARLRPLGPPAAENSWPVLGGNAAGSRAPALFAPDALFPLSASLPWPARAEADGPSLPSTRPVASRDALFVNRDGTIFALDRRSLRAKWVALAPETAAEVLLGLLEHEPPRGEYLGSHLGMGNVHHWRTFDNHGLATLSVSEGRLFAVRVEPSRLRIPAKPWAARPAQVELANELSCYDAEHGSVLWRVGGGTLQPKGPLDECWFFTAPTVSRGQAYVLAARTGHLYALCLDAASGRLIWKSRIGAMEARQEVQRYAMQFFLADTAPPAVADGIAIFPTGQGLVCAYDAIDGSLLWAAEYPRADVWISRLGERINVPAGPWHPRQPLLQGGLCLLTPMDSRHLVALSIRTGAAVWQAEFPHGTALLGALDGRAYVQHAGVTCLDLRSGQAVWKAAEASRPVGIGALGRETVYVPERTCIRRLHVSSGEEQDALPWPPGAATAGNLLLLDDSLVACSPEQLTVCMPPDGALGLAGTRVAIAPGSPDPLLVRGMLRAWHGDASGAVGDFESALALAEGPADANGAARVRRQTAISLAGLAVKSKMAKLLVRASDAAPDEPAVHAELAVARLRLALSQAGGEDVVDTYLNLCREFGMLACAGPLGPASVWTQLAETVRRECADRPDLADQWRAQMDALIQQGAADGNVAVLADLARWAAFPQGRTAALMLLGTTLEQQGELDKARRAFAQVAASTARPEQRAEARTWLQRLSARPEGIRAESEEASACKLEFIPTAKAQWSVPGLLLQPEGAEPAALQGNVLVLENDVLKRVDASNGVLAWAADLPGEAQAAWRSGAGYPLYCAPGSGGVVVTRGVLFGVDLRSGQVAWHRAFTAPRRYVRTVPIPRGELIQRAHRGLPVPPHGTAVRAARVESLICGPTLVCELRKDGRVVALDPLDGRVLLQHTAKNYAGLRGARAAVAGGHLCLLLQEPARLLAFDLTDGRERAEWGFAESPFMHSLVVTSEEHAVLADHDRLYAIDTRLMQRAGTWRIAGGVSSVLCADGDLAVLKTLDGRTLLTHMQRLARHIELAGAGAPQVVRAERRGDVVYLLEANEFQQTIRHGPDSYSLGRGFAFRAVSAADGLTLWRFEWPGQKEQAVGPPLQCGSIWLLCAGEASGPLIVGVDDLTGREVFAATLERQGHAEPVPLSVKGGRIVVSTAGTVIALQPGSTRLDEALEQVRAAP